MNFVDAYEKQDFEFMLSQVFNHVPAGVRTTGDFAGEAYDEFWWSQTVERDGYIMVWYSEDKFNTFHTYHYPPEIYT